MDVYAKDGDDTVDASAVRLRGFTVFIDGGPGSDVLTGSRTRVNALFGDFVSSEVGNDRVTGGRGDDFLQGGPGDDLLDGARRQRRGHLPRRAPSRAGRPGRRHGA